MSEVINKELLETSPEGRRTGLQRVGVGAAIALTLMSGGSIGAITAAIITNEYGKANTITTVECDDAYRDARRDVSSDFKSSPKFVEAVSKTQEGFGIYLTPLERKACPSWVEQMPKYDDLVGGRS